LAGRTCKGGVTTWQTLSIRDQREEYLLVIIVGQRGTAEKRRRAIERGVKPVFVAGRQVKTESAIANHVLEEIIIALRKNADVESGDEISANEVAATTEDIDSLTRGSV
jgi:hypothetical protein